MNIETSRIALNVNRGFAHGALLEGSPANNKLLCRITESIDLGLEAMALLRQARLRIADLEEELKTTEQALDERAEPEADHIGVAIRNARREEGLTQEELGTKLGVGKGTVSNWERGSSAPRKKNMPAINWFLGRE